MTPDLSVITCTSDRPAGFRLCRRWLERQDYPRSRIEWIVVDDGNEPADVPEWAIHVRLPHQAIPRESFRKNMLAGLSAAQADQLAFCEDDDWYAPNYLSGVMLMLGQKELVGGAHARYYNVRYRRWMLHPNTSHASLSTTGFRSSLIPTARALLNTRKRPEQFDGMIWRRAGIESNRKLLAPESPQVVSIKGLPGRGGLGIDHTEQELCNPRRERYQHDPELLKLKEWIGCDATVYSEFGVENG